MELEFRPDFEAVQARWDEFWRGESRTPLVACVVPKPGVEPVAPPPYMAGHDGDFEPVIDRVLAAAASRVYLGAAVPFYHIEFGPDHFSTFLGCDLHVDANSPETSWVDHPVRDWDDVEVRFRPDSAWWQRTVAFIRALRRRCDGKLLISGPTLVANLDALVALRGGEPLLVDLVEVPDKVHRALGQLDRAYGEILDALSLALDTAAVGSINRHGMYSRGRIAVPQCDCSCMLGPELFAEFVRPALQAEMARLDAVEYHLDGPGALHHLEALCSLEKLDVVQWVAGSGPGASRDWSGLYRRIDELGKGRITGGSPEFIRRDWTGCQSRRVFYTTSAPTPAAAEKALLALDAARK